MEYEKRGGGRAVLHDAGFPLVEPRQPHPPVPVLPQGGRPKRHITGSKQAICHGGIFVLQEEADVAVCHFQHCILHMYLNLAPVAVTQGDGR